MRLDRAPGEVGHQPARRVIVVLGYSDGAGDGLHPVCAGRVAYAARVATADDVVVLSGWARAARHGSRGGADASGMER